MEEHDHSFNDIGKCECGLHEDDVMLLKELIEVESMHEQRERFGTPDIVVQKGIWFEIIDFDPHTERADIVRRYLVDKVEHQQDGDVKRYRITLQRLDVEEDQEKKQELAKRLLDKHHSNLKMSFAKCLVDGIDLKSVPELKNMLLKMRGDMDVNKQKNS
jgi:hypothetical protein